MKHELCIEKDNTPKIPVLTGNRIVELGYVLQWAMRLQYEHSKICTLGKILLIEEIRKGHGLVSWLVFECTVCLKKYRFSTENPNKKSSTINTGAVWGTLATGSTYTHLTELLSCMDIPAMPPGQFYESEKKLGEVWQHVPTQHKIS